MIPPNVHSIHSKAIDKASEDDRLWFEQHPGRSFRLRDAVPFEYNQQLPPAAEGVSWRTVVLQIKPGVRSRSPMGLPVEMTNTGATDQDIQWLFERCAPQQLQEFLESVKRTVAR